VFGEQFDRAAIRDWIGLGKIPHGVYQQALAVHVARVGGAFTARASHNGRNRDRKNLGHENPNTRVLKLSSPEISGEKITLWQYNALNQLFQP
jgi:hypothetical protein